MSSPVPEPLLVPPRQPRRRLSAADRRSQLITIGRDTFAELGYEATTVEEIARRAGITKPIVYGHFGGKEGLYGVIVEHEAAYILGADIGTSDCWSSLTAKGTGGSSIIFVPPDT